MNNKTNNEEITKTDSQNDKVLKKKELPKIKMQKFKDLEGKFLLVKVGTDMHPAADSDIEDIRKKLTALLEENDINCLVFVTHHAVEVKIIEKLPEE
jgi:hypothetical protein